MQDFIERVNFDRLNHAEYVHLLLNHLPVTGLFAALLVLIAAIFMRSRGAMLLGLLLIALFALSTYPVVYFGEQAAPIMSEKVGETGEAWLDHHKHLANQWKWLYYGTAAFALLAFIIGAIGKKTLWGTVPIALLLTIASLAAGAYVSDVGARIRHPELRFTAPPTHEHADGHDDHADQDHPQTQEHTGEGNGSPAAHDNGASDSMTTDPTPATQSATQPATQPTTAPDDEPDNAQSHNHTHGDHAH